MSEEPRNATEGRARRRASPAGLRSKPVRVEPEPPPTKRHELGKRVAVVYYLCRNHHLEHPHFMEVPLASPQGLYLRDVISRLDVLRGKGMAAKYSWSCKRRYKNGFVWHDLTVDDLLLPAQGTEYVLKGSELQLDQAKALLPLPDHQQNSSASNARVHLHMPTRQQESPRSPGSNQGWTSTSLSPTTDPAVSVIKEAVPPPPPQPALLSSPSASTIGDGEQCRTPHSGSDSLSPKTSMPSSGTSSPSLNSPTALHDAATQTDDKVRGDNVKVQQGQGAARVSPERPEIVDESHSKHPPAAEYHRRRSGGTLQSLIRAEAVGRRRVVLENDNKTTSSSINGKLKPASLLMRLMACGPNHPSFDLTSYRPLTPLESPSSPELFPLGVLKPGTTSASTVRVSETENSNCSLYDSVAGKLKRSPSSLNHQDGICEEACSKRMSDPSSGKVHSSRVVSFHIEKEKAVKIEDRLASGALVAIH